MASISMKLAIFTIILVLPLVDARLMNARRQIPPKFEMLDRAPADQILEFRLALKQYNMDILEATLLDVSDPESINYGKWWSTEQILDLIAPSMEEVKPVVAWLKSHGVEEIDVSGRDFIKAKAPIRIIEQLFQTQMYYFVSTETGKIVARAFGEVHVPDHLEVIQLVMGVTELVPKSYIKGSEISNFKRHVQQDPMGYIYPGILRKMYQIPTAFKVNPKSSFGVVEYTDYEAYTQQDLASFNQQMNENVQVQKIVGPFNATDPQVESTLDVQYGAAIALNTTFWYWTAEQWLYEFATDLFTAKYYPLVVSMSWGWPEIMQCDFAACVNDTMATSLAYVAQVNKEYIKIGLKGITLLAASGDLGANGDGDIGCAGILTTIFPGASPWVTSVGGTMLVPQSVQARRQSQKLPPVCNQMQCATTTTEGVSTYPTARITSGGGFSNVSDLPLWQKDYVNAYLKIATNLPYGQFQPTKRGFPDVAANAHNYLIYMQSEGGWKSVDGTSAATPVFGGIISLLNSYMLDNGKNSIGFANPLLYKMYAADKTTFTDITTGNNYCTEACCGNVGYVATPGWDAVTGLGTPMFPKMQQYLKKNVVNKN